MQAKSEESSEVRGLRRHMRPEAYWRADERKGHAAGQRGEASEERWISRIHGEIDLPSLGTFL